MKNYEIYADKLKKNDYENFCKDFIIPNVLKSDNCGKKRKELNNDIRRKTY